MRKRNPAAPGKLPRATWAIKPFTRVVPNRKAEASRRACREKKEVWCW